MAGLKDIAADTGVSVRTVSRALKDNGYVSPEVRARVLEAAQRLNYRPNRLARSLKTSKSCEVMALTWSMDELHAQKIYGLEEVLRGAGYWLSLLAASEHNKPAENESLCAEVFDRSPAAVVAIGVSDRWQFSLIAGLMARGIPCLILDTPFADANRQNAPAPGVYADRQSGVYDAVCYLHESGRRRIMYAGIKDTSEAIDRTRLGGYRRAVEGLGVVPDVHYFDATAERYCLDGGIAPGQFTAGRAAAAAIMDMPQRPEAVQAFTDVMAMGMLDEFHRRGVRIPEDIAIVGFDNRSAAQYSSPPLTTVALPGREIGRAAAELIIGWDAAGDARPAGTGDSRVLPASLIRRVSA